MSDEEDDKLPPDISEGVIKAVDRSYEAIMRDRPIRPLSVHPKANEAKEDYLSEVPGELYRLMRDDIALVWGLLESPIEQVAIFQLAAANYGRDDWPIYAKVARERGAHDFKSYPVQIIPQVSLGRYRVDFLIDLGPRGTFAIECDGEEFHQDKARDRARDDEIYRTHGVLVMRAPGKVIWWNNEFVSSLVEIIRLNLR